LRDFKEEVAANLSEKITDYVTTGFSGQDAFYKAISSLGDIRAAYVGQQRSGHKDIDHKYIGSPRRMPTWLAIMAVIALLIAPAINRNRWLQQSPPGYQSFWEERPRSFTVLLTSENIQIEYEVLIEAGTLSFIVHDSQGELLWEQFFTSGDTGKAVLKLPNKGLAVVTIYGKTKARYRLNVSDLN